MYQAAVFLAVHLLAILQTVCWSVNCRCVFAYFSLTSSVFQAIGEDYVRDLDELRKLNDLVNDGTFIRDVSKVKQVTWKVSLQSTWVDLFNYCAFKVGIYTSASLGVASRCSVLHDPRFETGRTRVCEVPAMVLSLDKWKGHQEIREQSKTL